MKELKDIYVKGGLQYLDSLRFLASDDKKLRTTLFKLFMLFTLLDWGCYYELPQCQQEKLLKYINKLITLSPHLCLPKRKDQYYTNVNIVQSKGTWYKPADDLNVIVANQDQVIQQIINEDE